MARVGVFINLVGVLVIATLFYVVGIMVFSIDVNEFPA
jgi:hypothetical protein